MPFSRLNVSSYLSAEMLKVKDDLPVISQIPSIVESLSNGHYSGYIPVQNGSIFFWYFKQSPRYRQRSDSLTIWLNGGPGCSSITGSFIENGPFRILADGTFVPHNESWHHQSDIIYVEQPKGVSFSFTDAHANVPDNEFKVSDDFFQFLQGFYDIFPNTKSQKLYLTGESYAGFYMYNLSFPLFMSLIL